MIDCPKTRKTTLRLSSSTVGVTKPSVSDGIDLKIILIIAFVVIVIVLVILFLAFLCLITSEEKALKPKKLKKSKKSPPKPDDKEEPKELPKSLSSPRSSISTPNLAAPQSETFIVQSNVDYSKPIPLNPSATPSESTESLRQTDLKV